MGSPTSVEVKQVFVEAGCNSVVNNVSWGPTGLVSFGAQNAVAIFSPEICTTLPGHKATATALRGFRRPKMRQEVSVDAPIWSPCLLGLELPGDNAQLVLAMGGLDNKIHIYCGERTGKFVPACLLEGHTDWIRCLNFSLPIRSDQEEKSMFLLSPSQD